MPTGPWTYGLLTIAVFGLSTSAPLMAYSVAPVLAVVFWRNLGGAASSAGYLLVRRERLGFEWVSVLAGLLLAVHFTTWLQGLRMTSVTAATALVCTTPVWTVALDLIRRVPVPRGVLIGVAVAMLGVLAITGVDAAASGRAVVGDLLSLVGAVTAAGYVWLGANAQERTTNASHTLVTYGTTTLVMVPFALLAGTQLTGFRAETWLQLLALVVCAQLLGHTVLLGLLPRVGVTTVALATLLEIPGATLLAWAWTGDTPRPAVLPGAVLMLLGLVLVVRAGPPGLQPAYASADRRSGRARSG